MKGFRTIHLVAALLLSSPAGGGEGGIPPLAEGPEMIDLCRNAYVDAIGRPINSEVDRVYAFAKHDVVWLAFAIRAFGYFEEEIEVDHGTAFNCNVATQRILEVQWLKANDIEGETMWSPPQIDVQPKAYEDFNEPDERFTVHMYLRRGDSFVHAASQRYSDEWEMRDEGKWERWRKRLKEKYGKREFMKIQ